MFAFLQLDFVVPVLRPALLTLALSLIPTSVYASGDHDHDHETQTNAHEEELHEHESRQDDDDDGHKDHDENDEHAHIDSVSIDATTAKRSNIITAQARSGRIAQTQRIFGKVVNDASQISHLGARFDGTIIKVNVSIGDKVKKGTELALIESNQSLHPYIVTAPFDGMIIERHANPGELTQDQPLFSIYNDKVLWAEFKIFPNQMRTIKEGKNVLIDNEVFKIAHIIPNTNNAPYELARVRLDNHDHGWRAGVTLKGNVITQTKTVKIRIPNIALQQVEGSTVVFIKYGDTYEASPVTLGLKDNEYSEVLSGLNESDEYVIENSYLIKADLEKAAAEHVH